MWRQALTLDDVPVDERLRQLLEHLGIKRAHFAAGDAGDIKVLAEEYPQMVASLTLDGPGSLVISDELQTRIHLISGDDGPRAQNTARTLGRLPGVRKTVLKGYFQTAWSDTMADRAEEIRSAMLDFLGSLSAEVALPDAGLPAFKGEIGGISYRVEGSGPPLVLLPLALAASQWEPLLPALAAHYCTICLGGPYLGGVAMLEDRGETEGYQRMLGSVLDALDVHPGETILDVGCGSGVVDRWLARSTKAENPITALDMNAYFLREASWLATQAGIPEGVIEFQEGNAEALPFPSDTFDVGLSVTVLE
jgi:hypothetical protein